MLPLMEGKKQENAIKIRAGKTTLAHARMDYLHSFFFSVFFEPQGFFLVSFFFLQPKLLTSCQRVVTSSI
jgi:hypothetical protein